MSRRSAAGLATRALLRAFARHRFRLIAAVFAGTMCVALTTSVFVIASSVNDAIESVSLSSVANAERVVQARSSSGMSLRLLPRMKREAPGAKLAPVLLANTRLAESGEDPILVAGAGPSLAPFLPAADRKAVESLPAGHSIVLGEGYAHSHGLEVGSRLPIQTPNGKVRWRVAALVPGAAANGGALAITSLPALARAFQREGVADLVLASGGGSADALQANLEKAVGQAASVIPPSQANDSYQRAFEPTQNLLDIFVAVAVLAAGAILFFCWRLALEDAREELVRLRLCGARVLDLALAAAAVMAGIFAISVLVGGPIGILIGAALSSFTHTLITLTQLAANPGVPVVEPLTQSIGISLLVFAITLGSSVLAIRQMSVIEAVVGRREVDRVGSERWRLTVGVAAGALVISLVTLLALPASDRQVSLLPLLVLLGALSLLAPTVVGALIRRRSGFASLAAGRELALSARRTASLLFVFGLAIAMAIALQGAASSLQDGISHGVERWTGPYLFVQPAQSGANLQDDKFGTRTGERLARLPGVKDVAYFTYSTVELHETRVPVWTWGPDHSGRYANFDSTEGPSGEALWHALEGPNVAISSNYARLYGTKLGEQISVPTVGGAPRQLRVVAVVDDLTTTTGMLLVGPRQYLALTGDRRSYEDILVPRPGASTTAIAARVENLLDGSYPGIAVYDQAQIRDRFNALTGQLVGAFIVFSRIMFVLALLVGGATLATGLSLRRRSLALTRLAGAPVSTVQAQLRREALALGLAAWLIAAPVGIGLVYALIAAIAAQSGLLPTVELPTVLIVASLPLALAMSILSLLAAAPRRRIPLTVVALAEE
jgi:putative ABC transport system permease protein